MNRRTFLTTSTLATGAWWMPLTHKPTFAIPSDFYIAILATNWGFNGSADEFCKKAKESGYDGIEIWAPRTLQAADEWMNAIKKYGLVHGFLVGADGSDHKKHLEEFKAYLLSAVRYQPIFVNCHSGKDYFTFEQNKAFIDFTTKVTKETGIPITHETHRARILYAAHITKPFIQQLPDLRLTLDISHWCNVHSSLLEDQAETVDLALTRTDHIHSRIGHEQSPQVTDPRAPEWEKAVNAHFAWWDKVVETKIKSGKRLTMTTEFGPPNYMATVPFTHQPLANLWEVNTHMMQLWRKRYQK